MRLSIQSAPLYFELRHMPKSTFVSLAHAPAFLQGPEVTEGYKGTLERLHALEYYGMVKSPEDFPEIRQTFNLLPSLVVQIQNTLLPAKHPTFLKLALGNQPSRRLKGVYPSLRCFQAN